MYVFVCVGQRLWFYVSDCVFVISRLFISFSVNLYYAYVSRKCLRVLFCLPKKDGVFFGSNSISNFLKRILVAFGYSERIIWQKLIFVFATLRDMLENAMLRTESHEPSCPF